jgi:hypothetical protein
MPEVRVARCGAADYDPAREPDCAGALAIRTGDDLSGRNAPKRAGGRRSLQDGGRDVIAIELALASGMSGGQRSTVRPEQQPLEQGFWA